MTKEEMRNILSQYLAKFRGWTYAQLAERVEQDGQLEHVEGTAPDGTVYQMEFQAFWDDEVHGNVRVHGDLSAAPQRPMLRFIPIYTPDTIDSFIMSPDGRFVGERPPA